MARKAEKTKKVASKPRATLARYLDKNYEAHHLFWNNQKLNSTLAQFKDWQAFQRDKEALYLYTWRETDDWWLPHIQFVREVQAITPKAKEALDYLCATGWNGLRYDAVAFADYKTRCSQYLRWRLRQDRSSAEVYDLDKDKIPVYPCVVCLDGAHRYDDPFELVATLAGLGEVVIMDADSRQVDAPELMAAIGEAYPIIHHKIINHYVHFVAFTTDAQIVEEE